MNLSVAMSSSSEWMLQGDLNKVLNIKDDFVYLENLENSNVRKYSISYLERLASNDELRVVLTDEGYQAIHVTESQQRHADALLAIAKELHDMKGYLSRTGFKDKDRQYKGQIVARRIFDERKLAHLNVPSKSELSRIRVFYRTELAEGVTPDFTKVMVKTRNKQGKLLAPEIEELVTKAINEHYLTLQQPSVSSTYRYLESIAPENLKPFLPKEGLLRTRIKELPRGKVILGREGETAYKVHTRSTGGKFEINNILERVELDAMHVVLGLVDEDENYLGYFTLYLAIDCASRCIVGYHIEPKEKLRGETPEGVLASIRSIFSRYLPQGVSYKFPLAGLPECVVMDHGPGYFNKRVYSLLEKQKIDIEFTGTKMGYGKPHVEALVKTLRKRFFPNIDGYRDPKKIPHKDKRPEHDNCVRLSELRHVLDYYIHKDYHQSKHNELGTSPKLMWEKLYKDVPPLQAKDINNALFRTELITRNMNRYRGITLNGQQYYSPELVAMFDECDLNGNTKRSVLFDVFYDPNDAQAISVINQNTGEVVTAYNRSKRVKPGMGFVEANAPYNQDFEPDETPNLLAEIKEMGSYPKAKGTGGENSQVPDSGDINEILDHTQDDVNKYSPPEYDANKGVQPARWVDM